MPFLIVVVWHDIIEQHANQASTYAATPLTLKHFLKVTGIIDLVCIVVSVVSELAVKMLVWLSTRQVRVSVVQALKQYGLARYRHDMQSLPVVACHH